MLVACALKRAADRSVRSHHKSHHLRSVIGWVHSVFFRSDGLEGPIFRDFPPTAVSRDSLLISRLSIRFSLVSRGYAIAASLGLVVAFAATCAAKCIVVCAAYVAERIWPEGFPWFDHPIEALKVIPRATPAE